MTGTSAGTVVGVTGRADQSLAANRVDVLIMRCTQSCSGSGSNSGRAVLMTGTTGAG